MSDEMLEEDKLIHNEWLRKDVIEKAFGIKPYAMGVSMKYLIGKKEMLELWVSYTGDGPRYLVEHSKIDAWHHDLPYRKETGRTYSYFDTFKQVLDYFHKWFRRPDDDEQLELF